MPYCHSILPRMCRGTEEERSRGGFQRSEIHKEDVSTHDTVACALCGSPASLHCPADDAFLCRKCDRWVHGANFLAQRHIRCFLCNSCQGLTHRHLIATSTEVILPLIVSRGEKRQCDMNVQAECSTTPEMPFLFLWVLFSPFPANDSYMFTWIKPNWLFSGWCLESVFTNSNSGLGA